jgi:uncharacterized beta-barrel protein YwiB (DUF1934 family)
MHETVDIFFKMNINNNDIKQTVEFNNIGKRYIKNNKTFLMFKEPLYEENKDNDLLIICDKNEIVINRSGFINMKQRFKVNEKTIGIYKNEYINSELSTFTNKYDFNNNNIVLDYNIINEEEIIGNYILEIKIKGVRSNE